MDNHSYVMMVDEDQEILSMLTRLNNLAGNDATKAADGKTALELLEEYRPNLVILDIEMPDLDGLRVRELIREHSGTPVVMLTAKCEVTTLHDALLRVMGDQTGEPITSGGLLSRLTTKLRSTAPGNFSKN